MEEIQTQTIKIHETLMTSSITNSNMGCPNNK